jgi:hypothetical protein
MGVNHLVALAAIIAAAQGRSACRGWGRGSAARRVTILSAIYAVRRQIVVARSVAAGTPQPPGSIPSITARIQS